MCAKFCADLKPNLQNFVYKINIRNSFAILLYVFGVSANKLSYEKFTRELRKNYERNVR